MVAINKLDGRQAVLGVVDTDALRLEVMFHIFQTHSTHFHHTMNVSKVILHQICSVH